MKLLYDLSVHALTEQQRRARVSEIMQAHGAGETGALEDRLEERTVRFLAFIVLPI